MEGACTQAACIAVAHEWSIGDHSSWMQFVNWPMECMEGACMTGACGTVHQGSVYEGSVDEGSVHEGSMHEGSMCDSRERAWGCA